MPQHKKSIVTVGAGSVDIQMTLTRNAADYFGTYGDLTFRATDPKINQQIGSITLKTIELPPGSYAMDNVRGTLPYPLRTAHSVATDPLRRDAGTAPKRLGVSWGFLPPKPPGVSQEDYDVAMDSSLYIQPKDVYTHSGLWSGQSLFCILVGGPYAQVAQRATHAYPGIEQGRIYTMPGFVPAVTLTQQLKMNLWVYSVERLSGKKPKLLFVRHGDPKPVGPVPPPLDKQSSGATRPVVKTR